MTSATSDDRVLAPERRGYFQARLRNRIHAIVLRAFLDRKRDTGFTRADLARKLGKRPEQVTRLLASPGNWTLDTISDLLLALDAEPDLTVTALDHQSPPTPRRHEAPPDASPPTP